MKTLLLRGTIALSLVALVAGCATTPPTARLIPSSGQELIYYRGDPCIETEAVTSKGPVWVSICAVAKAANRASLELRFVSNAAASIHIDESTVAAEVSGAQVEVLAFTALAAEERRRQAWAAVAAGLAAAGNSMAASQAGYSSYSGTAYTNASAYGSGGFASANATTQFSGTTYNAGAAYAAQARANAENARLLSAVEAQNALRSQQIGEALRPHTLAPGESHGTYVEIEHKRSREPQPVSVSVLLDDAEVAFSLQIVPG